MYRSDPKIIIILPYLCCRSSINILNEHLFYIFKLFILILVSFLVILLCAFVIFNYYFINITIYIKFIFVTVLLLVYLFASPQTYFSEVQR